MSLFTSLIKKSIIHFLRKRKKVLILLSTFIIVLISLNYFINRYVDEVVGELIREFVHEKSNGFYKVDFDEIAYILNNGRFLMTDFKFDIHPDHQKNIHYETLDQNYLYSASIPNLHIDIIDFWSIFVMKKLRVIGVEVNSPEVKIINLNKNKTPKKISFEAGNLYKVLSGHLEELKINDFAINNGTFDFETYQGADFENYFIEGLTFRVENFQLNERSTERNDKFFYTDDIFLEVRNQQLLLKDSIHKLTFANFYISTKNNELGFEKLNLTRRDKLDTNIEKHDHYEIFVPHLRFSGIDFISAYNENFLDIDSINIQDPRVHLVKRTIKQRRNTKRNNFMDMVMMYHDFLEIDHFNLRNATLSYTDETQNEPKQYSIDRISADVANVKIDTGQNTVRAYGFDFGNIELMVKDYEVTLPDSVNTMKFDELVITSNPLSITLKDLSLIPDDNKSAQGEKSKFYAHFPYIVINGFDLPKALNQNIYDFKEFYLEQPEIKLITVSKNTVVDTNEKKQFNLVQLVKSVNDFSNQITLDKFQIKGGNFLMHKNSDQAQSDVDVKDINIVIANLSLDSLTAIENRFLSDLDIEVKLGKSQFHASEQQINLGNFEFSSISGKLVVDTLTYAAQNDALNVDIPKIYTTGFDLNQAIFKQVVNLDTLKFSNVDIKYNDRNRSTETTINSSPKSTKLPVIKINHLIGENYDLTYEKESLPVFVGNGIDLQIEGLILDQSLSEVATNQFDFKKIHQLYVDHYYFHLQKQQHFFSANQINWTDDSNFSMKDISLAPYQNPNNEYRISIPFINFTGIDLKKILKESYYDGTEILIEQPHINLKLTKGRQKKLTNLDLGFIPILLRNRFLGARSELFRINKGIINVHQKTDSDSLIFECDNFNLSIEKFEVDSTTEMVPNRFLFANDVRLFGDYLSYYQPQKGNFASINHFDISTLEKDLLFEGLYFATNTNNKPEMGKTKITADHLNLRDLDFFDLTQNQLLSLSELSIDNASINLTPLNKNSDKGSKDSEDPQKSFNEKKNTNDQAKYTINNNTTQDKSKGLNIHENEYLFDTLLLKQVEIDKIFLNNTSLKIAHPTEKRTDLNIPDIWVLAEGLRYDPVLAKDSNRIFYSDNILTRISNLEYIMPDNLSAVKFNELFLNLADSSIKIKNFALDPRVSKFDYGPAKGYQSTWLKIENDSISIEQVDFLGIINERVLDAKEIDIHNLDLKIYRDKRIPFPEWQRRALPQVELHNIDFTVQIDTINLNDSYIGYQEHAEKSNTPGEIFFSDLNAKVVNLSNDTEHLSNHPKTNISATTKVFGKGNIIAEFQFDMVDPDNIHTYGIEVDPFDLTEFNRILIPNASAQVKSGTNNRIVMTAKANEHYSYGEMSFYYNDLKVQLLNRETETPKGLGNVLGSFFANTFIIRTNNPKNFVLRKGDIFFERDKKRAIFNYWTKTFLSGVISSIGAVNNKKKIRKMQEEKLKELEEEKNSNLTLDK